MTTKTTMTTKSIREELTFIIDRAVDNMIHEQGEHLSPLQKHVILNQMHEIFAKAAGEIAELLPEMLNTPGTCPVCDAPKDKCPAFKGKSHFVTKSDH